MTPWIRALTRRRPSTPAVRKNPARNPLSLEPLEDRTTPTASAITSNFNGTAIPAGDGLWFNSVAKVSGLGSQPAHVQVTGQTIDFDAGSTHYHLAVPDTTITFDPSLTAATTSWTGSGWAVATPPKFSGNVFVSGLADPLPGGLPGGIKNVTWQGNFSADVSGLSVNWQWSAAVYTGFGSSPSNPTTYGVKAVDDPNVDAYRNSDHAGTPEAIKKNVIGGACGGGGSNYTGSYSGTAAVVPTYSPVSPPPPASPPPPPPPIVAAAASGSISGFATAALNNYGAVTTQPLAGVTIQLVDATGAVVGSTTTGSDGSYTFAGLAAGTYTVQEVVDTAVTTSIPSGGVSYAFSSAGGQVGTVGGATDGTASGVTIGGIVLGDGQAGVNYDFTDNYTHTIIYA